MIRKLVCVSVCLGCLFAWGLDVSSYRRLSAGGGSENLLKNPSFLEGSRHWHMGVEYSLGKYGPNQAPGGIRQVRNSQTGKVGSSTFQEVKLRPRTTYEFGGLMWTSGLKMSRNRPGVAAVGIDWMENGRCVYGMWPCDMNGVSHGNGENWTQVKYSFTTPPNPNYTYILFPYMSPSNVSGEARWTNLFLREARANSSFYYIHPKTNHLLPGDDEVEVALLTEGTHRYEHQKAPELRCAIAIKDLQGKLLRSLDLPVKGKRLVFRTGLLPVGHYEMTLSYVDSANCVLLGESKLPLGVLEPKLQPANAVLVDRHGRLLVKGKPFLPIGIYTWSIKEEYMKLLKDSGFNMITPYGSLFCYLKGKKGAEGLRASLDLAWANGLHVCPDLRDVDMPQRWEGMTDRETIRRTVVRQFKEHPAILSWYVSDEPAPMHIPIHTAQKNWVNLEDPWHPVWAVYNNPAELGKYAPMADLPAMDPYPVRGAVHEQRLVLDQCQALAEAFGSVAGHGAFWMVPQTFSWSLYGKQTRERPEQFRQSCLKATDLPTEREILGMTLAGAIYGVKGYVCYSFAPYLVPAIQQRRWGEVARASRTLAAQADLILGVTKGPEVQVKMRKGKVLARGFRSDDGLAGVFVVSVGPGESEADIVISDAAEAGFSSQSGASRRHEDRCWRFHGKGIDYDILR